MLATYRNILTVFVIFFRVVTSESSGTTINDDIPRPDTTIEECFNKNSVSCIQIQMYRNFKSFVDRDKIDLASGLSLVREEGGRKRVEERETEDIIAEEQILSAQDLKTRESAIESFVYQKLMAFFQERSIRWELPPALRGMVTARGLAESLPANLHQTIYNLVTEGQFHLHFEPKIHDYLIPPFPEAPLWSSGQTSWLQIQRSGFDFLLYQIF
jgi:hypothetical protein